tara:strand:- start:846 stop:1214 length:369 start_codon:yes stop_codon:yes gene_type:complete
MKKLLTILALVALAILFIPFGMVYSLLSSLWWMVKSTLKAIWEEIYNLFRSLSKIVSVASAKLLRRLLIQREGIPFGTHSVSAVLGANQREKTLSRLGEWLANTLDGLDPSHCVRASESAGI